MPISTSLLWVVKDVTPLRYDYDDASPDEVYLTREEAEQAAAELIQLS